MALPDLTTLTDEELRTLLSQADALLASRARDDEATEQSLREDLGAAVATLDALIGDGTKNLTSITGVRQYTPEEMAGSPQLAFPLAFEGLEILARVTRDVARIASGTLTN